MGQRLRTVFDLGEGRDLDPGRAAALFAQLQGGRGRARTSIARPPSLLDIDRANRDDARQERTLRDLQDQARQEFTRQAFDQSQRQQTLQARQRSDQFGGLLQAMLQQGLAPQQQQQQFRSGGGQPVAQAGGGAAPAPRSRQRASRGVSPQQASPVAQENQAQSIASLVRLREILTQVGSGGTPTREQDEQIRGILSLSPELLGEFTTLTQRLGTQTTGEAGLLERLLSQAEGGLGVNERGQGVRGSSLDEFAAHLSRQATAQGQGQGGGGPGEVDVAQMLAGLIQDPAQPGLSNEQIGPGVFQASFGDTPGIDSYDRQLMLQQLQADSDAFGSGSLTAGGASQGPGLPGDPNGLVPEEAILDPVSQGTDARDSQIQALLAEPGAAEGFNPGALGGLGGRIRTLEDERREGGRGTNPFARTFQAILRGEDMGRRNPVLTGPFGSETSTQEQSASRRSELTPEQREDEDFKVRGMERNIHKLFTKISAGGMTDVDGDGVDDRVEQEVKKISRLTGEDRDTILNKILDQRRARLARGGQGGDRARALIQGFKDASPFGR